MRAVNTFSAALLLAVLFQGLLVRLARGQRLGYPFTPWTRAFWGLYPGHPLYDNVLAQMRKNAAKDVSPRKPSPQLPVKPAAFQSVGSPEKEAPAHQRPDSLAAAWTKAPRVQASGDLGKPPGVRRRVVKGGRKFHKRPLDTVGSDFVKKSQDKLDEMKRQLDHVGIGLMRKRPLDHLGQGLFKKGAAQGYGEKKTFNTGVKELPEDTFQTVISARGRRRQAKRSAVQLIKKGLDVLGTDLFKRSLDDPSDADQLSTALDQISTGLGDGDEHKGVDVDLVRRGLDHLGAGLLKRGLDTVGLGLIKRGVDTLDRGLERGASGQALTAEGMSLLRKGLEQLAACLTKDGLDADGLNQISQGATRLASWFIQQQQQHADIPHHAEAFHDKKPEPAKKHVDKEFELSKEPFDKFEKVFPKERSAKSKPKLIKPIYNGDSDFNGEDLDEWGAGFFPKGFDSWAHHRKEEAKKQKKHAELKAALEKQKRGKKGAKFLKDVKSGPEEPKHKSMRRPLRKKTLDELGTGFIKKDLDYVGSGLIKKEFDDSALKEFDDSVFKEFDDSALKGFDDSAFKEFDDSALKGFDDSALKGFDDSALKGFDDSAFKEFDDPDWDTKEKLGWLKKTPYPGKSVPEKMEPWLPKAQSHQKYDKIMEKKSGEKTAVVLNKQKDKMVKNYF